MYVDTCWLVATAIWKSSLLLLYAKAFTDACKGILNSFGLEFLCKGLGFTSILSSWPMARVWVGDHANAVGFLSSSRADLLLLHRVLTYWGGAKKKPAHTTRPQPALPRLRRPQTRLPSTARAWGVWCMAREVNVGMPTTEPLDVKTGAQG